MSDTVLLLGIVIVLALIFDVTNGFHDTANAVATSVSTRALTPRVAILIASIGNLLGAFASTRVAETIGQELVVVEPGRDGLRVLAAACAGAIAWNLITWWLALPSSSSYALVGGLVGAAVAAGGVDGVSWSGIVLLVVIPAVISPIASFAVAFATMAVIGLATRNARPAPANRGFRTAQVGAGAVMAFAHGTNDAQKTMGVIGLALVLAGRSDHFVVPTWAMIACAVALAIGTYAGGWRIMRTLGTRVYRLHPPHGFAAQTSATAVLLTTAAAGLPVSSTHAITGSIFGAGSAGAGHVRWSLGVDILAAWIITLPAAALIAALAYVPFALG